MLPIFRTFANTCQSVKRINRKVFHTNSVLYTFWEKDDKGGYQDTRTPLSMKERMREGLKELKYEIALWSKEIKEDFESDPLMIFRPGETDVVWKFVNEASLKDWIVTADSDHSEGYSKCSLILSKNKKGLFSGELSTTVPKDGRIKRSGYCNIKTLRARVSRALLL